ncbi:methionine adenosyltransferase [Candidatus Gottesmanbacteria bacterium CG11_big_fil_rev_8_21_14_0_20_37_11]|uniref:Methionine adenosyltransferase n=3 Tax=Candidatus Gottesmaniibacteriota TaxID=1752720 RepID=A0A2M7RR05_9BACT|nr:MAG: methionine adenosyltransferase [Candidatus Gottesmanbacteria bacterium CG1_02_37_22]PIP32922.1 MAG: methionine adenosyltransferase [Candidatus Gottesmanbacteria bacterium CG23_combo_of_CG06-09_8_20_14_all_37_19]PIR08004.1 MAG: methionine adenosyltransferase [Candidatus Gottesmanbacteria bacterium CG11_big_fil_rev_8_21_14_0_20_37_11]PIZ02515.1 MAG: methionine adenosyltransferase [Candidatus Gottesmanbacteria bacterium CG_4_10_14_0_8_um_filter_37_24]
MDYRYFSSESVAAGHPDKICDQISDAILDACLTQDRYSHTAVECLATINHLTLAGEIKSKAQVDIIKVARDVIKKLDYDDPLLQFTYMSPIDNFIHQQSPDIAKGVDRGGAGDQGMMFGYATSETPELMPMPIMIAHALVRKMDKIRVNKILSYLRPDGKSQVKVRYEKGKPVAVERVILAVPHKPAITNNKLKNDLLNLVVKPVLSKYGFDCNLKNLIVNGTGRWEIGGPASDTGVTGRKIIVDTYGGMGKHGGGCFSGKEPTKVDRGGAYATRFIAKNIVAHHLSLRCEVQVAYVIGRKQPVVRAIETFGTHLIDKKKIEKFAWNLLDLSVSGIVNGLNLLHPIYKNTACYGHFGRNEFPWEKIMH